MFSSSIIIGEKSKNGLPMDVSNWYNNNSIIKDPAKSIFTHQKTKVGDNSAFSQMVEENSDRILDQILKFPRQINPMVSVSYSNADGRPSKLPVTILRDGAFRPPIWLQQDTIPLSRMPHLPVSYEQQINYIPKDLEKQIPTNFIEIQDNLKFNIERNFGPKPLDEPKYLSFNRLAEKLNTENIKTNKIKFEEKLQERVFPKLIGNIPHHNIDIKYDIEPTEEFKYQNFERLEEKLPYSIGREETLNIKQDEETKNINFSRLEDKTLYSSGPEKLKFIAPKVSPDLINFERIGDKLDYSLGPQKIARIQINTEPEEKEFTRLEDRTAYALGPQKIARIQINTDPEEKEFTRLEEKTAYSLGPQKIPIITQDNKPVIKEFLRLDDKLTYSENPKKNNLIEKNIKPEDKEFTRLNTKDRPNQDVKTAKKSNYEKNIKIVNNNQKANLNKNYKKPTEMFRKSGPSTSLADTLLGDNDQLQVVSSRTKNLVNSTKKTATSKRNFNKPKNAK